MKGKDLLLIGGLIAGGYLIYKYLGTKRGGAIGGGGGVYIPEFPPVELIIKTDNGETPEANGNGKMDTGIRFDYSKSPTIPVEYIQGMEKRINVLENIGETTIIPQLQTVTSKAIDVERKKQTIGTLQNIRDTTIIPQLGTTINRILGQMP